MTLKSRQRQHGQMPEINLVPMMDVIMTVLTFFIIISMTLTSNQGAVDVTLPSAKEGVTEQKAASPLIVGLSQKGEILLGDKAVSQAELAQQMKAYLQQNSKDGAIILKADRKLPYEQVVQMLGKMRDIGGDRVSLAIDGS